MIRIPIVLYISLLLLFACAGENGEREKHKPEKETETLATVVENPAVRTVEPVSDSVAKPKKPLASPPDESAKVSPGSTKSDSAVEKVPSTTPPEVKEPSPKVPEITKIAEPVPVLKKEEAPEEPAPVPAPEVVFSHDLWDQLLRKHVSAAGKVNYRGFKQDQAQLQQYLGLLRDNPPASDWSRNQKLAYWINVYNAFTVKLIIDNYPTKSITSLEGGKPWDKRFVPIGDQTYTLSEIENAVIRPRFKEPRIHFAVNCAAQSCPELLNKAFTADNLNSQLERLTRQYINNPKHNTLSANKPKVSQLFNWYADDFKEGGTVIDYINRYANTKIDPGAKLEFLEYDWGLNE